MKITFRQVDAFRTVVSTGTVTEAAAPALPPAQPAGGAPGPRGQQSAARASGSW